MPSRAVTIGHRRPRLHALARHAFPSTPTCPGRPRAAGVWLFDRPRGETKL